MKTFLTIKSMAAAVVLVLFSLPLYAQNKVVVIPMAGDDLKPLSNIITVAKKNGDFSNPAAALNSIDPNEATRENPYLIVIAPGVYTVTEQLILPANVDIAGSGRDITQIVGEFSDTSLSSGSAVLVHALNFSTVRDITISNRSNVNGFSTGIHNNGILTLLNVEVSVFNGVNQTGIFNSNGLTVRDSEILVSRGAATNTGIGGFGSTRMYGSLLRAIGVTGSSADTAVAFTAGRFRTLQVSNSIVRAELGSSSSSTGTIVETDAANRSSAFFRNSTIQGNFIGDNAMCFGVFEFVPFGQSALNDDCQ